MRESERTSRRTKPNRIHLVGVVLTNGEWIAQCDMAACQYPLLQGPVDHGKNDRCKKCFRETTSM